MDSIEIGVGHAIRRLRLARELTQLQLAERAGLARTHLHRVETGQENVTVHTLQAIAEALDVEVRQLFPRKKRKRP